MFEFIKYLTTAFALIFVIEGLVYALFPDAVRKLMAMAISLPVERLRLFGAIMATTGFFMVWLMKIIG